MVFAIDVGKLDIKIGFIKLKMQFYLQLWEEITMFLHEFDLNFNWIFPQMFLSNLSKK